MATTPLSLGIANAQGTNEKPNVILILANDMGYSGTTFFGGMGLTTPTINLI